LQAAVSQIAMTAAAPLRFTISKMLHQNQSRYALGIM
jgi:hypothetical protein